MTQRYALYWAPPAASPLDRLGQYWLGRDTASGQALEQPAFGDFSGEEIHRITAEPRRYGLHATLKPPFRLAAGYTAADVESRLASFAAAQAPVRATRLRVALLGHFVALVITPSFPAINALAASCVEAFDCFGAPPDAEEFARRRRAKLTARQEENLVCWGYPYVMNEFQFHVSLTGTIERTIADRLLSCLTEHFAPATTAPLEINEIALFTELEPGAPFQLTRRFGFAG